MRIITRTVAAAIAVCALGGLTAGCGGDSGPKVSGTADAPPAPTSSSTTVGSTTPPSTRPAAQQQAVARLEELAVLKRELTGLRQDLADSGSAIDGANVDTAKQQEGSAP